jgi:hypothetical protein
VVGACVQRFRRWSLERRDDFTVPDSKAPTVTIAAPTSTATFATSATSIALAGTASDDGRRLDGHLDEQPRGSGAAAGTTSWSVASVAAQGGSNIITVTARDGAGNIATDVLTVTKRDSEGPSLSIVSPNSSGISTTAATVAHERQRQRRRQRPRRSCG